MATRGRIQINIDRTEYERLQKNIKTAGLNNRWLGKQISALITALDTIVAEMIANKERGLELSGKENLKMVKRVAEESFGMKIEDIQKAVED